MMSKIALLKKGFRYLSNSGYRMSVDTKMGKYVHLSDEEYIALRFRRSFNRELNLDNPTTFNEKLQWLKLFDRRPEYTVMVDKLAVKRYVADKIGEEYIIPTLGVWDRFEDIDFDALPNQFVLKCTHDSGGLVICKDKSKFDKQKAEKKLSKSLAQDFYMRCREWPYKNVPRKIIAEKYMEDCESRELRDYKIHCFNGEPKFTLVCRGRFSSAGMTDDFYSNDWVRMDVCRPWCKNADVPAEKPEELEKLLVLARQLSKDIPFLRTDFYIVNHKIYFGELTLYPTSGFTSFVPDEYDNTFGSYLILPVIGK